MTSARAEILTVAEAAGLARDAREAGDAVVMCHGCFDIVHPGHVRHLQQARRLGDRLLVTVTGDALVGKGADRPLIPQEFRAENLAALDCVDWVAVSDLPTAADLLSTIRPDVYVKGREYEHNHDPRFEEEKSVVESYGGRVVFTSGDVVFSSTALIRTLEETADPSHADLRRLIDRHGLEAEELDAVIGAFHGRRVLVVGETITDTYVLCDRPDVAGEGPVMTLRPIECRRFDGGAAIIARHLAAMGARPTLLTALPPGLETETFSRRLEVEGVEVVSLEVDRKPIEKQRFLVGTAKVMKLDLGDPLVLDAADQRRLVGTAVEIAAGCEATIVADFGLGLLTAPMLGDLCAGVRPHVNVLAGDVSGRRSNLLALRSMDLVCPSELEIREALHDYEEGLTAVVWHLLEQTRSRAAIVTLGSEGLIAFDDRRERGSAPGNGRAEPGQAATGDWVSRLHAEHVPSFASYVVDQLGCGDALLAAATLTLSGGGSLALASILGSVAAATEARKLGNAVIGAADLRRGVQRLVGARLTFDLEPRASHVARADDHLSVAYPQST